MFPVNGGIKAFTMKMKRVFLVLAALFLVSADGEAASADVPGGLSLKVDESAGTYKLTATAVGWSFAGNVAGPMTNVITEDITDGIGTGKEISFTYVDAGGGDVKACIRVYASRPVAVFDLTIPDAATNTPSMFPAFTTLPQNLHAFSHRESVFAGPNFGLTPGGMPWVMFDDSARTWILSPASHFLASRMSGDGKRLAATGLNPAIQYIPAGTRQRSILAVNQGINKTWETWGRALTDLQGKKRPANDADPSLKYFGYWTDNGATYYYNYDQDLGCAGTFLALAEHYRKAKIPLGYMQLDSWWYEKSLTDSKGRDGKSKSPNLPPGKWNRNGGLLEWKADTALFPEGLAAFQKKLGLPLIAHNRWVDPESPYRQIYKFSGYAPVGPGFWDEIEGYLKSCGGITYEQDWFSDIHRHSPELSTTVDQGDAFMDNMARACRERGLTMQYCMELPCDLLQGSKYDNLTSVRVSGDRFDTNKWMSVLFTSRLASALGEWPWVDVFRSTERGNMLMADLSAGIVGVGDAIGQENRDNIMMAVRGDGVIVKPDASLTPTDDTYIAMASGNRDLLIGSTYTDHAAGRTAYVFAFSQHRTPGLPVTFTPASLGVRGPSYVWNEASNRGTLVAQGSKFTGALGPQGNSYYIVAPIFNGIALVGDAGQFVSMGKQRIASLQNNAGNLTADVLFAPGDASAVLHGFAEAPPRVTVSGASAAPVKYDATTKQFSVIISPTGDMKGVSRAAVVIESK